jgi:hypothetical protein
LAQLSSFPALGSLRNNKTIAAFTVVRRSMAIGVQQTAIRSVIASALAEHASESGRSVDALFAMRQAEAIVKALELAGYEIKRRI